MAELPEIIVITNQMREKIKGKKFEEIEIFQKKCLNCYSKKFVSSIIGEIIEDVFYKGKWFVLHLRKGFLIINPGMGADIVYFEENDALPSKYQFKFTFDDGTGFTIRFWWFGYVHFVKSFKEHKWTKELGQSPLDPSFTFEKFLELTKGRKGNVKSFLLNQKNVSGIGNFYIHDILFEAKIHPLRKIETLKEEEKRALYDAMKNRLFLSLKLGGADYELNFLGGRGNFTAEYYLIGYKEGKECPQCGTKIEKIKTGGNYSFVCTECQR